MAVSLGARHLVKRLRRRPAIPLSIALIIAAGITVATGGYAAVRALWLRPPAVPLLNRIVEIRSGPQDPLLSWLDYQDLRTSAGAFERMTVFSPWPGTASVQGQSRNVVVEAVSGDYFNVLGLVPAKGRLLNPADDAESAPPVVAMSERLWRLFFSGSIDGSAQVVQVNDRPFTVVGVVPSGYRGGMVASWLQPTDIWMPLTGLKNVPGMQRLLAQTERDRRRVRVKALLSKDTTLERATADVLRVATMLDSTTPLKTSGRPDPRHWALVPLRDVGPTENEAIQRTVTMAYAAIGIVVFVILVTILSLMVARSDAQAGSLSIRSMIGATRGQLVKETLAESTCMAVAGGVLGIWSTRLLLSSISGDVPIRTNVMAAFDPQLGPIESGFAAAFWLVCLVALSAPGWLLARAGHRSNSRSSIRVTSAWRGRSWIIGSQLAVSIVASMLALTAARQAVLMSREDFGFDLERIALATARVSIDDVGRLNSLVERITTTVGAEAGIASVSVSSGLPGSPQAPTAFLNLPGESKDPVSSALLVSSANTLETLGLHLSQGRFISAADSAVSERVLVIDSFAAQRLFGSSNALGRQVQFLRQSAAGGAKFTPELLTVIGVVGGASAKRPSAYVPVSQHATQDLWVVVKTTMSAGALVGPLSAALSRLPDLTVATVDTGIRLVKPELAFQRLTATITVAVAAFALVVGLMGLYGLLAHAVRRREEEIAVRLALGATRWQVIRGVAQAGMIAVGIGTVGGVGFGVVARMATRPAFLQAVPTVDTIAIIVVPAVVLIVSLCACYIPAWRAGRVDPSLTLRRL